MNEDNGTNQSELEQVEIEQSSEPADPNNPLGYFEIAPSLKQVSHIPDIGRALREGNPKAEHWL